MIRVGTCSWADESFVKAYYPKGVDKLAYYAERFGTVEANSTYYRLPDREFVAGWAAKLPDGFVMHVKAFGLMTRHPVKAEVLPPELRELMPVDERGRVDRPSRDARAAVFEHFLDALEPLRSAGKLGGILMQMAPYVVPKEASYDYLAWARDRLDGYEVLVEFRHKAWFEEPEEPLRFLEEHGMTFVIVDAPLFPLVVARTTPTAYMRLHGRNAETWHKRTGSTAERFDYLYSAGELEEVAGTLRGLEADGAETVYAMFNNNGRSTVNEVPKNLLGETEGEVVAQAPTNAAMLKELLAA